MADGDTVQHRLTKVESMLEAQQSRMSRLEGSINTNADEIDQLQVGHIQHETRLENGRKAFDAQDRRLSAVEERTTPQPPSVIKVVTATLGVFFVLAGALWGLSSMLADRPTSAQIEKLLLRIQNQHETSGHQSMRSELRTIQTEQIKQRQIMETMQKTHTAQGKQLKEVLDRLPPRRTRRRNRR